MFRQWPALRRRQDPVLGRVPLVPVFSLVVRIPVGSEVLAGLDDKCGIAIIFRYAFSSTAGYRGERIIRYIPLEHCVRLPPSFSVYGLCGEFSVLEISFFVRVL